MLPRTPAPISRCYSTRPHPHATPNRRGEYHCSNPPLLARSLPKYSTSSSSSTTIVDKHPSAFGVRPTESCACAAIGTRKHAYADADAAAEALHAHQPKYPMPSLPPAAPPGARNDARRSQRHVQPGRRRRPTGHSLLSTRRASTHRTVQPSAHSANRKSHTYSHLPVHRTHCQRAYPDRTQPVCRAARLHTEKNQSVVSQSLLCVCCRRIVHRRRVSLSCSWSTSPHRQSNEIALLHTNTHIYRYIYLLSTSSVSVSPAQCVHSPMYTHTA